MTIYYLKDSITFKRILLFTFFAFIINVSFAQKNEALPITTPNTPTKHSEKNQNFFTQIKYEYGGIIETVKEEGIEHYYAVDLRVAWQKRKNDVYSKIYNAAKFGFGFYSGTFNNNAFGEPNALYGFFDIPVSSHRNKWNWIYSIGAGLAFNFHYYDPEDNPSNELLGSGRNAYVSLSFEGRYNITNHWAAGFGLGFKHFSNGRLHLPNRGINLIPLTLMAEYNFGENYTDLNLSKLVDFIPFNILNIYGSVGNKNFEYDKAVYFKSTFGINFLRQFHYKHRFGAALELFYTAGSLDRVTEDKSNFNKQFSYGIAGIWELVFTERLYIPINFGIHLSYNEENLEQLLYQRLGLGYLLGKQKNIILGVNLKVTEFHADFLEWKIGYSFKKDKNKYELLY